MRFIKALKELILNTLFPPRCVSCKKEGDFLCINCLKNLNKKKIRPYGKKMNDPDIHHLDGLIYALDYAKNPQIQVAVKQFKYRFTQEVSDYFADLMVEKIGELNMVKGKKIVLVPVPLHKKRLNYRGFNQAEVIAKAIQYRMGNKAEVVQILERVRHTDQQAKLNKEERRKNLKEAFILNTKFVQNFSRMHGPPIFIRLWRAIGGYKYKGKEKKYIKKRKERVIYFLVDDVFTTGATLENCAEVLKSSGLERIYGLVIARAFK